MSDQCLNIEKYLEDQNPQDFLKKIIKGPEDLRSVEGILSGKDPLGWLVVDCPNFFFMPSLCYNQFFFTWDNGNWNCPKYWKCKNFTVVELYCLEDGIFDYVVTSDCSIYDASLSKPLLVEQISASLFCNRLVFLVSFFTS